jgi:hypothetical protein
MKTHSMLLISLLATLPAFAADAPKSSPVKPPTTAPIPMPKAVLSGPQVTGLFQVLKVDGATVIQQAVVSPGSMAIGEINVATADALVASQGKCAFNVRYNELSQIAATGTTNRLYDNDTLVAQNTKIDLAANQLVTIRTQPYLVAGRNNVKLVINAESATPSIGWVRVNVSGTCGAEAAPPVTTKPPVVKPPLTPPVVVRYGPGSAEWNNLYNAWGYSNYATTQLRAKGYARYADLVTLNANLTTVVNAKAVEKPSYESLMARWNSFTSDAEFKAAMATVVPGTPGKK